MKLTQLTRAKLTVNIPDTRGVEISRYGKGNLKIGPNVYTYSMLPITTCPGSTEWCRESCYAKRVVDEEGIVSYIWDLNSRTPDVPPIPNDCKLLRIHVSGDFNSVEYIEQWIKRLEERPEVQVWAYTRSWRVPELLPHLEKLRAMSGVNLFASMDESTEEMPPDGWRRAWIDGDKRLESVSEHNQRTIDYKPSYICPEETGRKKDCESCGYCIFGHVGDVTFLKH